MAKWHEPGCNAHVGLQAQDYSFMYTCMYKYSLAERHVCNRCSMLAGGLAAEQIQAQTGFPGSLVLHVWHLTKHKFLLRKDCT